MVAAAHCQGWTIRFQRACTTEVEPFGPFTKFTIGARGCISVIASWFCLNQALQLAELLAFGQIRPPLPPVPVLPAWKRRLFSRKLWLGCGALTVI